MTSKRRIVITLGRDGTVHAETEGVLGPACLDTIPLLEDLLGAQVVESSLTPDYDAIETTSEAVHRTTLDDFNENRHGD